MAIDSGNPSLASSQQPAASSQQPLHLNTFVDATKAVSHHKRLRHSG